MSTSPSPADESRRCARCGQVFPDHSRGDACVHCLLLIGLEEPTEARHESPAFSSPEVGGSTTHPFEPPPPQSRRFQHYEVCLREDGLALYELGRGAMGVTYKALDTNLGSPVALKVINARYSSLPEARARFRREARNTAQLRHPNVASIFHFGEDQGQCFYAMEFIEGETLQALVQREGSLPLSLALEITLQVARALIAADKCGLVHRDLKPANLMVSFPEGSRGAAPGRVLVKVIDLGLAKAVALAAGETTLTHGGFLGTPQFASPEQIAGSQPLDTRSDIYSLGATLWFLLSGQVPFSGRSLDEIYDRQLHRPLPLKQLEDAKVPAAVTELLQSMLAADPQERPASPAALYESLERCQRENNGATIPPEVQASPRGGVGVEESTFSPSRRVPAARWGFVAALLAVLLFTGVAFYLQGHRDSALQRQGQIQQQQLAAMAAQLQQQTRLIALVSEKIERTASGGESNPAAAAQQEAAHQLGISLEELQHQLSEERADVRQLLAHIDERSAAARAQVGQWEKLKREALTKLGEAEYAAGHYREAIPPYQQALALSDESKEPLAWCDAAQKLAEILWRQARYAEAESLVRQVVEKRTTLQGAERADTLNAMSLLACVLWSKSDLEGAESLHRRCLEARERTLGADHRDTLKSMVSLGSVLNDKGDHAGAESLYRRALAAQERTLGPEHPDTLVSTNNLAGVLDDRGDVAGAESLYRSLLEVEKRVLGEEHPNTVLTLNNLAFVLAEKGDLIGAEPLYRQVLEICERTLGQEHHHTLRTANNLVQLLADKGDLAGAESLFLRAQAGMERSLPPENSTRLDLDHYFSLLREKQGRLDEALALAEHAVAGARKTLPESSPLRRQYEQHLQELRAKKATTQSALLRGENRR